ncbi:hypothetical protein CVT26_000603 [Gymnopilus dilepis]|uniref:Uncharacterized protein n=1 Tax=Gymnopilus dilepis TaxID=231916 RepID=A0A409Y269_9AGAR|nr:hypothetical protein CVT26_000603 [Gymnopilus dilepis]
MVLRNQPGNEITKSKSNQIKSNQINDTIPVPSRVGDYLSNARLVVKAVAGPVHLSSAPPSRQVASLRERNVARSFPTPEPYVPQMTGSREQAIWGYGTDSDGWTDIRQLELRYHPEANNQ